MNDLNFGDCIGCGLCVLGCPAYEETGFDVLTARGRNKALQAGLAAPEMMDRAARIGEVCARHGVPLKAAALQFILAHPAIVSVIPGARSIQEVEDNVRMVELPIPGALWAELKGSGLIAQAAPTPRS